MPEAQRILDTVVRFAETDLHGHVFFGEFFTYMDETFNELLRLLDYRYERMHAEGWTTNIVHAEMDYQAPAEYEDTVENRMRIEAIGERSLTATYEAGRPDGTTLATGDIVYVAVDFDGDEGAIRVPDAFRDAVVAFQAVPPDPV